MDYYNFKTFDITQVVKQYKGKTIDELFPNHEIIKNDMGEFMEIIWKENDFPNNLNLSIAKKKILRNLKTIYYIGEKIEKKLIRRGIRTLNDLRINLTYNRSATSVLKLINNKDYKALYRNRYIYDLDVIFCFNLEDLLFIDIETLGIYDSPIIIIGTGFYKDKKFEIHQYFARDLEEEISICEHLRGEILPKFKCFVSYNGKSFDIPYIANRFLYFFDVNPMISEEETPYEKANTKFHHIDLYHGCRRIFKGIFESYSLTTMEEKLLDWKRENELPSSMVGLCYKKYTKNPKRYVGLIKECIEHNYYDVYSMPLILKRLLEA